MRGVIKFVLSLVIVVAVVWIGLWWYAQGRLQAGFDAWAEKQATAGFKLSYDSEKRGTSPLKAELVLTNLRLTIPDQKSGHPATITLPTVGLRIEAATPLVFNLDLPNKIAIDDGGDLDAAVTTGSIAVSDHIDPNALFNKKIYPFSSGDLAAADLDVLASQGSLLVLHIDSLSGHVALNPQAGSTQQAVAETVTLNNIGLSPILTRIASIPFDGKITKLGFNLTLSGPVPPEIYGLSMQLQMESDPTDVQKLIVPIIHKWASGGGNGSYGIDLVIGPSAAKADAAVKFDANLQPNGTADVTADHLDQFLGAITNAYPQIQGEIDQATAMLTPYISTSDQGGQTLTMHVVYGNGAVNINGNKVADMPPLDWNKLENPPAPSPDDTNDNSDDGSGSDSGSGAITPAPAAPNGQ